MIAYDVDDFIRRALAEDVGDGDHTSCSTIPESAIGTAHLLVKEEGVIAGLEEAARVFRLADPRLEFTSKRTDGDWVFPGDIAFLISGPARSITTTERLVLNIMQRMSGIATRTRRVVQLLEGTGCRVLDTRKTTPGFRHFEKRAVVVGGGVNHRFGLYDMILVKDNHIDYAGGVNQALQQVREYIGHLSREMKVEVEARTVEEVAEILNYPFVFRILLDNFNPGPLADVVRFIGGRVETEASGGITASNCREYALSGVNFISMGELTHSVHSLDLSLKATRV